MKKEFHIDTELYPKECIDEWISDFSEVASISFDWNELNIIWEDELSIQEIFNEFMNYLISIID